MGGFFPTCLVVEIIRFLKLISVEHVLDSFLDFVVQITNRKMTVLVSARPENHNKYDCPDVLERES